MGILTDDMKRLVREQKAGLIATVCPDRTPNLSAEGHYRPLDTLGRPSQAPIGRSRKSCWMKRSFATAACSSGPVSPASAAKSRPACGQPSQGLPGPPLPPLRMRARLISRL